MTTSGDKALTEGGTRNDAEVATCEDKQWASLIHMMAMDILMPPSIKTGVKRTVDHSPVVLPEKLKKSKEKVGHHDRKEVANRKPSTSRKFLRKWQEQLNWVVHHEAENKMTCKTCCAFPHLVCKTDFLVGCRTFKKRNFTKT